MFFPGKQYHGAKPSFALHFLYFKILTFAKLNEVFQMITFQGMKIFDVEIPIGENVFDYKFVMLAMINESILFAVAEYIKREALHSDYKSSSRSSIKIETWGTMKYFS